MEQSKKKKTLIASVIAILILIVGVVGATYAFFNYTRTGPGNTLATGIINFSSSQSGNLAVTNAFPMTSAAALASNQNTVTITVTGNTNYEDGLEYLITAEDVNIETTSGKKVPLSIVVGVSGNGLGTASTTGYFTTDRGHSTSYYKILNNEVLKDGDYLLAGYIAPFTGNSPSGVNGTISITAYLDESKILISDTYDGTESDNMGTLNSLANGKTVLTTSEWNSITGNNVLSFKVRVQSNEGVWVGDPTSRNDMKIISGSNVFTSEQKASITKVNFIRMSERMINNHTDLIDLTASGGQGVVKGWLEDDPQDNTKKILYIASPGVTYFPAIASGMFYGYTNATSFNFSNINTSNVTSMDGMFAGCSNLTNIDLSNFSTGNVTTMYGMFNSCSGLINVNLSNLGGNSLTNVGSMFNACSNLQSINMSGFNFSSSSLQGLFASLSNLTIVDLSNANVSSVTNMSDMFNICSSLTTIYVSNTWDVSGVTSSGGMFSGCSTALTGGNGTHWSNDKATDKTFAIIDEGPTSLHPGYLTLKNS